MLKSEHRFSDRVVRYYDASSFCAEFTGLLLSPRRVYGEHVWVFDRIYKALKTIQRQIERETFNPSTGPPKFSIADNFVLPVFEEFRDA